MFTINPVVGVGVMILFPRRYLAMSGDTLFVTVGGLYWHLVSRGQWFCKTSGKTLDGPTIKNNLAPNVTCVTRAKIEKSYFGTIENSKKQMENHRLWAFSQLTFWPNSSRWLFTHTSICVNNYRCIGKKCDYNYARSFITHFFFHLMVILLHVIFSHWKTRVFFFFKQKHYIYVVKNKNCKRVYKKNMFFHKCLCILQ